MSLEGLDLAPFDSPTDVTWAGCDCTATSAYIITVGYTNATPWPFEVKAEAELFVPGRRRPVWPDEPRTVKPKASRQVLPAWRPVRRVSTAPSR